MNMQSATSPKKMNIGFTVTALVVLLLGVVFVTVQQLAPAAAPAPAQDGLKLVIQGANQVSWSDTTEGGCNVHLKHSPVRFVPSQDRNFDKQGTNPCSPDEIKRLLGLIIEDGYGTITDAWKKAIDDLVQAIASQFFVTP